MSALALTRLGAALPRTLVAARTLSTAPALRSDFKKKELAEEAAYIRKYEMAIMEKQRRSKATMEADCAELEALIQKATRPHVKELLEGLVKHEKDSADY